MPKLIKDKCEISGCEITECLHLHHIIPRTELNTSNHPNNLAVLCPTHHNYVHIGKIKIIGVVASTKLPNKRTLIYEIDGERNLDIEIPLFEIKPKLYRIGKLND